MENESERTWKEVTVADLKYDVNIRSDGLEETAKAMPVTSSVVLVDTGLVTSRTKDRSNINQCNPVECVKNNPNGDLTLKLFNDVVLTTAFL
jgi:hypothetical protein